MVKKRCNKCGKDKPLDDFQRSNSGCKHGRRGQCKECYNARQRLKRGITGIPPGPKPGDIRPHEGIETDVSDNAQVLTAVSSTIRTVDDALAAAKVDLSVWYVDRAICNKWDQGSKLRRVGQDDQVAAIELWQIKIWLKRKVPKALEDLNAVMLERMQAHSPKYPKIVRPKRITDPHLLEVGIADAHFGKLCWAEETGQNYDLKIAERIYQNAVAEIVSKTRAFPIEKIIFPIGNDFFNIDNLAFTTTAGTPQDVDGRYSKIFEVGETAVIRAIDYLLKIAPVEVLFVPGNHDRTTSYHLAHLVKIWYRNAKDVHVDDGPKTRKYTHYGKTLIGFTHGNEEKHQSLPGIMAGEMAAAWADSSCREWHLGHFHKAKQTHYNSGDTHDGVMIRVLRSISGTDAWSYRKGYVGGARAADGLLYSKEKGFSGHFPAYASE